MKKLIDSIQENAKSIGKELGKLVTEENADVKAMEDSIKELSKDIGKELGKYFNKNIETEVNNLQELINQFEALFAAHHELIGRVLKCHLIAEKYVNDLFTHFYGKQPFYKNLNLKFYQKIILLTKMSESMLLCYSGLKDLNEIRNRLAHNLSAKITMKDVMSMKPLATIHAAFFGEEMKDEPISVIELFTNYACMLIADEISETGLKRSKHVNKLIAMKWKEFKDSTKKEPND